MDNTTLKTKETQLDSLVIFYDNSKDIFSFTAKEMKKGLELTGHQITLADIKEYNDSTAKDRIVLTVKDSKDDNNFLVDDKLENSLGSQRYSIRKKFDEGFNEWQIIGTDDSGTMYGGLDLIEAVKLKGLEKVGDIDNKPYINKRGIKFNIPLDARTPSYTDSGDSAQKNIANMWEMDFWREFLDEMARRRYNVLSLWNLHPFPSMVKVPSYPNVALDDVMQTTTLLNSELEGRGMSTPTSLENLKTLKVMTIDQKIEHWQKVMEYAKNRGIGIYIFTWNTFIYGTENSGYDFSTSVDDKLTQDYFRKSVEALLKTYPLLEGIGITSGENMSRDADKDEAWLYNTYGQGINDALAVDQEREFTLIHRIQYANIRKALNQFSQLNPRCTLETSFKYAQAHMYSSVKPDYIYARDNKYLNDIGDHKTWLTVRDDDYYMFRGGCDPEFARAYIKNMPYEKLKGFYMGPDGYTWGREYISKEPQSPNELVIKKRWFSFMLFGRLAYNPDLPREDFVKTLQLKFPNINADKLLEGWSKASKVIPLVNRLHNKGSQLDFQWYPEACTSNTGFHDINRFIETEPQSGESILSIPDYAKSVVNNESVEGTSSIDISKELWDVSTDAINLIKGMKAEDNLELRKIISDINALALLGKYYSKKIAGATYKCIADQYFDIKMKEEYQNKAINSLREASSYWQEYAELVGKLYNKQTLTRLLPKTPGLPRYTDVSELQKDVDNDINLVK